MAGETIEFAKPVIGTSEPAPAILPILLKIFRPVKNAERPIKEIETIVLHAAVSKPLNLQKSKISCPIQQINPPITNAKKQFFKIGELGDFSSFYLLYCSLVSIGFILCSFQLISISINSKS